MCDPNSNCDSESMVIIQQNILWFSIMLESRTHVLHPLFTSREVLDPSLPGNAYPYSGDPRYQPSPANPGSQPWRVSRWVMNSRPGVTLFTLTRIVGLAHPCRTRPCHLAFSRDFDTSHSRVVSDTRIPWVVSELMYSTCAFNIWNKVFFVENLFLFFFFFFFPFLFRVKNIDEIINNLIL